MSEEKFVVYESVDRMDGKTVFRIIARGLTAEQAGNRAMSENSAYATERFAIAAESLVTQWENEGKTVK